MSRSCSTPCDFGAVFFEMSSDQSCSSAQTELADGEGEVRGLSEKPQDSRLIHCSYGCPENSTTTTIQPTNCLLGSNKALEQII